MQVRMASLVAMVLCCFAVSLSAAEQPPTVMQVADAQSPFLGEVSIDKLSLDDRARVQNGHVQLRGPLPSFVKVWQPNSKKPEELEFSFNPTATEVTVHLPDEAEQPGKLEFLLAEQSVVHANGVVVLSALDAKVIGEKAALETHPGNHRIGFWLRAEDYVAWDFEIPSGEYIAELVYSRATKTEAKIDVAIGGAHLPLVLEPTGSWYRYRVTPLGEVRIDSDDPQRVEVRCKKLTSGGVMNLKAIVLTPAGASQQQSSVAKTVQFNRDIRPLLSDRCYLCHGPDEASREADLRLDQRDSATKLAIVPSDSNASEMIARLTSDDPDYRMPPDGSGKAALTPAEIELMRRWIDQGAEYEPHWAFVAPAKQAPPAARLPDWQKNPIDQFVLARLDKLGWEPSPRATRRTLLRRAAFDLTGLPPSSEMLSKFLADQSPTAWSRAIDRLLDSPTYGEHQARYWLDAARYADSNGYQYDQQRDQWAWRDWVIDSFNRNQPFDKFTIDQLAGDLLPNATDQQRLATGFNRNHPITVEGGVIDEEYRVEYVIDRTVTMSTTWLGMTVGCARCHDHKYDPLSQKEFYQLTAFFNQIPEKGLNGFDPKAKIASPLQLAALQPVEDELRAAQSRFEELFSAWNPNLAELERELLAALADSWRLTTPSTATSAKGANLQKLEDGSVQATGPNGVSDVYELTLPMGNGPVYAIKLIALPDESTPNKGLGRSANGNFVLSEFEVSNSVDGAVDRFENAEISKATASFSQPQYNISFAADGKVGDKGWAVHGEQHKKQSAQFVLAQPLTGGEDASLRIKLHFASQFSGHQLAKFQILLARDQQLFETDADFDVLKIPQAKRTSDQKLLVQTLIATRLGSADLKAAVSRANALNNKLESAKANVPSTMIMQDMPNPRGAYVLERGEYDKRREHVAPGTPTMLAMMPNDYPRNRLGLARWLTMPEHPLTSRVAANRLWIQLFGLGLVESPEDFGLQSPMPSHPALLDWLAVEYVESGWDTKALLKTIMMSQTYRQSSAVTQESFARDPQNRFLTRGPRIRLDAEVIRDSALAVSGLLNQKVGGPSVFPYHPKGLWLEVNNRPGLSSAYKQDSGDKLYRRSLYTYWKRTVPPPSMAVFDAPTREYCQVRRSRTNTPLQAFVMLHDPQFVEAARALAQRMLTSGGVTTVEQIRFGFETCLGRQPNEAETKLLVKTYTERLKQYRQHPQQALALLSIGQSPRNEDLPQAEHAAMCAVGRLLLNLSEFVTKG